MKVAKNSITKAKPHLIAEKGEMKLKREFEEQKIIFMVFVKFIAML